MIDSLANWPWLISLPAREEAVVIDAAPSVGGSLLTEGFSRTRYFDPGTPLHDFATLRETWEKAYLPASLDCVATLDVDALVGTDRGDVAAIRLLAAIRRSLRSGSGMYLGFERLCPTSSRMSTRFASRHARQLRSAGFTEVRTYYVERSPALPFDFIPVSRSSVVAWDRAVERPGVRSEIRRRLMALGLHAAFFRHRLVLARA